MEPFFKLIYHLVPVSSLLLYLCANPFFSICVQISAPSTPCNRVHLIAKFLHMFAKTSPNSHPKNESQIPIPIPIQNSHCFLSGRSGAAALHGSAGQVGQAISSSSSIHTIVLAIVSILAIFCAASTVSSLLSRAVVTFSHQKQHP